MTHVWRRFWLVALLLGAALVCHAHPVTEGRLQLACNHAQLTLTIQAAIEQIAVWSSYHPEITEESALLAAHAEYLARRFQLRWSGRQVLFDAGRVNDPRQAAGEFREFVLELRLPEAEACDLSQAEIFQDVLREFDYAPGNPWEAFFVLQPSGAAAPIPVSPGTWVSLAPASARSVWFEFLCHGLRHILGGYDHLLFVTAVVLGAPSLLSAMLSLTLFTLSHSLTLALAGFGLLRVPSGLVEPAIALSLVMVGLAGFRGPGQRRGSLVGSPLGIAVLGLFHGLGFGAGLGDVLADSPPISRLEALGGFTLGIELGHLGVLMVIGLSLKITEKCSIFAATPLRWPGIRRIGSLFVAICGVVYLALALRDAL